MKIRSLVDALRYVAGTLLAFPTMALYLPLTLCVLATIMWLPVLLVLALVLKGPGMIPDATLFWFTETHFLTPYPLWMEIAMYVVAFSVLYNVGFRIMPAHSRSLYYRMHPRVFVKYITRPMAADRAI